MIKKAITKVTLPVNADKTLTWDNVAAEGRVRELCGGDENTDWGMYAKAFLYYNGENAEEFGAYKLQIADVIDGKLQVIWKAVVAAMAAINGARGGVNISDDEKKAAYDKLKVYYHKFDETAPDMKSYKSIASGEKVYTEMPITVNVVDEAQRIIRFIASTPVIDREGDRIFPEGADLTEFKTNPVFLYAHNRWKDNPPLGTITNSEVKDGKLYQDVKFWQSPEEDSAKWSEWDKFANMVWLMYKNSVMRAVSIGFKPIDYKIVDMPGRYGYDVLSWKQLELSACAIGMNPEALSALKSVGVDPDFMKSFVESAKPEKAVKKSKTKSSVTIESNVKEQIAELQELEATLDRVIPKLERYNQMIGKPMMEPMDIEEDPDDTVPKKNLKTLFAPKVEHKIGLKNLKREG